MVKIRLKRIGRKGRPVYHIVAVDSRAPRNGGRNVELLGRYIPYENPAHLLLNEERIIARLLQGAQPTLTVRNLLSSQGVMLRKHVQMGVLRGKITQVVADARYKQWADKHDPKKNKKIKRIDL